MVEKLQHLKLMELCANLGCEKLITLRMSYMLLHALSFTRQSILTGFETKCTRTNYDKTLQLAMLTLGMSSLCIATFILLVRSTKRQLHIS